jgi:hypothetical protein
LDDAETAQVLSRLERIQHLMHELEHVAATAIDRQKVRDRIHREIAAAKEAVRVLSNQR